MTLEFSREAFFLETGKGRRFCMLTKPLAAPAGCLLYVPPFAEELNKSRRMAALAASAFAAQGWVVLQMDLFGCGDSEGQFGDACWDDWVEDVDHAWSWFGSESASVPRVVWSLRAGSLLVSDWIARRMVRPPLLMWQPVVNGRQHLTQFLRVKAATEMLAESDSKVAVGRWRDELQANRSVEIAGYGLSPDLAKGMELASFQLPLGYDAPVLILEVSSSERVELSPALTTCARKWQMSNDLLHAAAVTGPAFWQTQEIETAPGLVSASLQMLAGMQK